MEFELRLQEFIELARVRTPASLQEAIAYARRHLLSYCADPDVLAAAASAGKPSEKATGGGGEKVEAEAQADLETARQLQRKVLRAMGLLACRENRAGAGAGSPYADLYARARWQALYDQFRMCALEIHSLPPQPTLHIPLSAGLSALKLPVCYAYKHKAAAAAAAVANGAEQNGGTGNGAPHGNGASQQAAAPAATDVAQGGGRATSEPAGLRRTLLAGTAEQASLPTPPVGMAAMSSRAWNHPGLLPLPSFPPAAGLTADAGAAGSGSGSGTSSGRGSPAVIAPPTGVSGIGVTAAARAADSGGRPLAAAESAQHEEEEAEMREDDEHHNHYHGAGEALSSWEGRNINCPVCDRGYLGQLAEEVPWSHHSNSTLICRVSGKVMDENDPPMALPNGRVYSISVSALADRMLQFRCQACVAAELLTPLFPSFFPPPNRTHR